MERLTHERSSGIKTGYWSPDKKEELVNRLAEYENTGLTPAQIREIDKLYLALCRELTELRKRQQWIPVDERLPKNLGEMVLVTCKSKKGMLSVNRAYCDTSGFWHGSGSMSGVVAWMPLPEPYKVK